MLRAFFVGNSFTVFREREGGRGSALHDLPGLLSAMAPGRLKTGVLARAGASLEDHRREGRLAAGLAPGWDVVVLQDSSRAALEDPGGAQECFRSLHREIRGAGARTVLFQIWPPKGRSGAVSIESGAELGAVVAPVGAAWSRFSGAAPDLDLYAPDGKHAGPLGAYLTACVFYRVLLGENPAARTQEALACDMDPLRTLARAQRARWGGPGEEVLSIFVLQSLQAAA